MKIVSGGKVSELLKDVPIPKMFCARQTFNGDHIPSDQIASVIFSELSQEAFSEKIKPGMEIAITAGSRGIANVDIITRAIVDFVKSKAATPFIVPAMGSHGGATAKGQVEVLSEYGITEESMGCQIRSSMDTVEIGISELGVPVAIDKHAFLSDGIIISCRLKPHNAFRGRYESGPCKMMAVGLGKQLGAERVHDRGMDHIAENIPSMARVIIEKAPILFAIPCIENAYDQTCKIEAILPEHIMDREPRLLQYAFTQMPRLIPGESDVLIVDEIGKNYSGTGVDPNITGTFSTPYAAGGLTVQRTCMLSLSEASHGNALGVGLASVISKRLYDAIDTEKMYPNCLTSTVLASARIPCVALTDKEAIQFCIRTCNNIDKNQVRVIRIPNSLHIGTIMLSEAYYQEVLDGKYNGLTALGSPEKLSFDTKGRLASPYKDF